MQLHSMANSKTVLQFFFFSSKRTFHFNSRLWANQKSFSVSRGKTGLDLQDTKLSTY